MCLELRSTTGWVRSLGDDDVNDQRKSRQMLRRVQVAGDLDRHAIEALYLEIRQLAKRYEVEVKGFRVEKVADEGGGSAEEETAE